LAWFLRDKRISDFSVDKTIRILQKHGIEVNHIEAKGYDFVLPDGKKVEVKFDTWIKKTGNISAEWWSDEKTKSEGWAQHSDADIMVYMYDFDNAYVVDMQKVKEYVRQNYDKLEKKYAYRKKEAALNVLVPIKKVPELRMPEIEKMFTDYAILEPVN